MENENNTFTEFAEAFDDAADYQNDGTEETDVEDLASDVSEDPEATEVEDNSAEVSTDKDNGNQTEVSTDSNPDAQPPSDETFILKVNKEEKTYSREEVINLAQKGADYDRVKDQLAQSRQTAEDLQKLLDDQKDAMSVLAEIAKDSNVEIPALLRNLRIGLLKNQGLSEDAANERLMRIDAERENAALKAAAEENHTEETGAQRAQREITEFREAYPNVELNQDILNELIPDVQNGLSIMQAYQKRESALKDAQIAELQRQLAAEKQNKENLTNSPGSQKDSGGKRTKSDYDDFLEAFG